MSYSPVHDFDVEYNTAYISRKYADMRHGLVLATLPAIFPRLLTGEDSAIPTPVSVSSSLKPPVLVWLLAARRKDKEKYRGELRIIDNRSGAEIVGNSYVIGECVCTDTVPFHFSVRDGGLVIDSPDVRKRISWSDTELSEMVSGSGGSIWCVENFKLYSQPIPVSSFEKIFPAEGNCNPCLLGVRCPYGGYAEAPNKRLRLTYCEYLDSDKPCPYISLRPASGFTKAPLVYAPRGFDCINTPSDDLSCYYLGR